GLEDGVAPGERLRILLQKHAKGRHRHLPREVEDAAAEVRAAPGASPVAVYPLGGREGSDTIRTPCPTPASSASASRPRTSDRRRTGASARARWSRSGTRRSSCPITSSTRSSRRWWGSRSRRQ